MFLTVNLLMALSFPTQREQFEQRMKVTWPRPFLLRPPFLLFLVCRAEKVGEHHHRHPNVCRPIQRIPTESSTSLGGIPAGRMSGRRSRVIKLTILCSEGRESLSLTMARLPVFDGMWTRMSPFPRSCHGYCRFISADHNEGFKLSLFFGYCSPWPI